MAGMINFTPDKFKQLKNEYNQAKKDGKTVFMFDGDHELLVDYAKYLIEYLSTKF